MTASLVRTTAPERVDTERLRQEHPLADLVASYGIDLRRSGTALVGRCPFHADGGRPNLTVFPRSGRFVCFRCQARGDVIGFIQQLEQVSFRDAVVRLGASPTPPPTTRRRPPSPERRRPRDRILDPAELRVLTAAVELYANRLLGDHAALDYLSGRGFAPHFVKAEHVGYAVGDELVPYLAWRRLPLGAARRVGLLDADGREAMGSRIVFYEFRKGRPVWLIGRLLDVSQAEPRYRGLPGSKPLLGWEHASRDLRSVCLVEGPLDRLALRLWGLRGLALCGTAIGPAVVSELTRWERIYCALDADEAGRAATARLIEAFPGRVIPVRLPPGTKDPAELAERVDGEALFRAAIHSADDEYSVTAVAA